MPIETIAPPRRLYRQVADQLRQLFESGEYAVGDRLPAERELAERMGISRPTIREALIALEVEGWVRIRIGSGVYVTEPGPHAAVRPADEEGPFEVLQAREFIESAVAEKAASLASAADIEAMDSVLSRMENDIHPGQSTLAIDRAFHTTVAAILDNSVIERVVGELFDQRMTPFFARLSSYFENPSSWQAALEEHRLVRDAIAAGDRGRARSAMADHLRKSQERFTRSFSSTSDPRRKAEEALPGVR